MGVEPPDSRLGTPVLVPLFCDCGW